MLDGLEHVTRAAYALADDGPLADRLTRAVAGVSLALVQPEEWPAEISEEARKVRERGGSPRELSPSEARALARDILLLWAAVEVARATETGPRIEPPRSSRGRVVSGGRAGQPPPW
jgi:hypothetical protein